MPTPRLTLNVVLLDREEAVGDAASVVLEDGSAVTVTVAGDEGVACWRTVTKVVGTSVLVALDGMETPLRISTLPGLAMLKHALVNRGTVAISAKARRK